MLSVRKDFLTKFTNIDVKLTNFISLQDKRKT